MWVLVSVRINKKTTCKIDIFAQNFLKVCISINYNSLYLLQLKKQRQGKGVETKINRLKKRIQVRLIKL